MKSIDAPSSGSAAHTEADDSSPTSLLRALDPDSVATLTDTETLRVLEVRRPTHNVESSNERDSYAVRVEERFQTQQRPTQQPRPALSLVPSAPRILPPPGAAPAAAPVQPAPAATKPAAPVAAKPAPAPGRGLTEELDKLTRKEYAPALVDLSSTTGVRHLRIELQKKPGKPGKKR
jgi:hypothetical protein